jgi:hypothetical protein
LSSSLQLLALRNAVGVVEGVGCGGATALLVPLVAPSPIDMLFVDSNEHLELLQKPLSRDSCRSMVSNEDDVDAWLIEGVLPGDALDVVRADDEADAATPVALL